MDKGLVGTGELGRAGGWQGFMPHYSTDVRVRLMGERGGAFPKSSQTRVADLHRVQRPLTLTLSREGERELWKGNGREGRNCSVLVRGTLPHTPWMPACAGMTMKTGGGLISPSWMPACAGMTVDVTVLAGGSSSSGPRWFSSCPLLGLGEGVGNAPFQGLR